MTFDHLVEILLEADPKKGTGKKPKGSGRRLYTDENPKDTVSVKFSTVSDIRQTLNKSSFKSKSHARQSQIINLIHQRVRAAKGRTKDPKKKKSLSAAFKYITKKKEASKKKTKRLNNLSHRLTVQFPTQWNTFITRSGYGGHSKKLEHNLWQCPLLDR